MHIPIIVFGFVLVFFVWRGYKKGFALSLSRYFSCLLAYLTSVIFTNSLSKIIAQNFPLEGLIIYFVAAGSIFLIVSIVANYSFEKLLSIYVKDEFIGNISKFSGAFIGMIAGCFVGLLMVYVINFSQDITASTASNVEVENQNTQTPEIADETQSPSNVIEPVSDEDQELPEDSKEDSKEDGKKELPAPESLIDLASKKMVSKTLSVAVDLTSKNPTTKTLTQALSDNPEVAFKNLKYFINDKNVSHILSDSEIQDLLRQGKTELLLKNWKFRMLLENKNMKAIFVDAKKEQVAQAMVVVWNRVEAIKNNPRVVAILSDREFITQINSANTMQLLMNPKLKELTEIIAGK